MTTFLTAGEIHSIIHDTVYGLPVGVNLVSVTSDIDPVMTQSNDSTLTDAVAVTLAAKGGTFITSYAFIKFTTAAAEPVLVRVGTY